MHQGRYHGANSGRPDVRSVKKRSAQQRNGRQTSARFFVQSRRDSGPKQIGQQPSPPAQGAQKNEPQWLQTSIAVMRSLRPHTRHFSSSISSPPTAIKVCGVFLFLCDGVFSGSEKALCSVKEFNFSLLRRICGRYTRFSKMKFLKKGEIVLNFGPNML